MSLEPIPELKVISQKTADLEGYKAVTRRISPEREPEIFQSIQNDLKGTNSRWIEVIGGFVAARHHSDLVEIERRLS